MPANLAQPDSAPGPTVEVLRHNLALDGFRGLAITLAMSLHFFIANGHTSSRLANFLVRVFGFAWVGVDLFFVLSGFLITGILVDSLADPHYFKNFYGRRLLRIFPLYYALIFVTFLVVPGTFSLGLKPLVYVCLFLQNTPLWFHLNPNTPAVLLLDHLWSLAVEEQFYLVWPVIVYLFKGRKQLLWLALALFFVAPLTRTYLFAHGTHGKDIYQLTLCRCDTLLAGALLALLVRSQARDKVLRYAPLGFLAAAVALGTLAYRTGDIDFYTAPVIHWGYSAIAFAAACLLAMALRAGSLAARAFTARWLRFMGRYSYGLYVMHFGILTALRAFVFPRLQQHVHSLWLYHLLVPVLALAIVIPLAMLVFNFYEKPFLRLKRFFNYDRGARQPG